MMQSDPDLFLKRMAKPCRQEVTVAGRLLTRGCAVRIRPHPGADLMDGMLAGRRAVIEGIDEDDTGAVHVAVTLEDDPGWDLGEARHPSHRFFFAPSELEPVEGDAPAPRKVLVAGIGNVFFGDDGFGVAVAQSLLGRKLPPGVDVGDFGIRGMDLAYALGAGYHAAILVDAVPWGGEPGTIRVIEPDRESAAVPLDAHRMDPLAVLQLARDLGPLPGQLLIVGCEPEWVPREDAEPLWMDLTPQVAAAVEPAADMVAQLAARIVAGCDVNEALSEHG